MTRPSLNTQILVAAILGLVIGTFLHPLHGTVWATDLLTVIQWIGKLFIGLLQMVVYPLLFCSVVVGIANLRQHERMGKTMRTTLLLFMLTMFLAMLLSMVMMEIFTPGKGLSMDVLKAATGATPAISSVETSHYLATLLGSLFINPIKAFAEGKILSILAFAFFVGVALAMHPQKFRGLLNLFDELFALLLTIIQWVMKVSPLGIFALLVVLMATQDAAILKSLMGFMALVVVATLIHGLVVLPVLLYLSTKANPLTFLNKIKPVWVTAFATSSSTATLPVSLEVAEKELKISPPIARFVLPLGSTINMDGTALYEAAAALFVANLVGMDMSLTQQLVVMVVAMLASMGAPGIPSAGMTTMIMVLQAANLPIEAIAILLPIDRILDTVRTAVNVEGDLVVASIVDQRTKSGISNG